MADPSEFKLPKDGWIATHQDGTVCQDWVWSTMAGNGVVPLIRFREKEPIIEAECAEGGETLQWQRVSVMPQNAAVGRGTGAVRWIEDEDR